MLRSGRVLQLFVVLDRKENAIDKINITPKVILAKISHSNLYPNTMILLNFHGLFLCHSITDVLASCYGIRDVKII